ncbi:hypothetical protein F4818DRAFT_422084 [Hypoxylon cercidicola]|nr:hypothetical protein F4818DRAFT_422084 [Hypoxylon cercidicola]
MLSISHIANPACRGREMIAILRESWPYRFARNPADRCVCSVAGILRWMAIIHEELQQVATEPMPVPPHELIALALAKFPNHTDSAAGAEVSAAIANCTRALGILEQDEPNVFDIMESPLMAELLWSKPRYLLCDTTVLEKSDGMFRQYNYPVEENVKSSLVRIVDPFRLAATVKGKLGDRYSKERKRHQFYIATPPDIIRVCWNNSLSMAQNGNRSIFDALQAFELSYKNPEISANGPVFVDTSTSYRLICLAIIHQPGEVAVAEHLYQCDGVNFVPRSGDDRSQDWSCQEPGKYYMLYRRSDQVRYRRDGIPTPERANLPPNIQELGEMLQAVVDDAECSPPRAHSPDLVQHIAPDPPNTTPAQPLARPTQPLARGSSTIPTVQPPATIPFAPVPPTIQPIRPFARSPPSISPLQPFVPHPPNITPEQSLARGSLNLPPTHPTARGSDVPSVWNSRPNRDPSASAAPIQPRQPDGRVPQNKRPYDGPHDRRPAPRHNNPFPLSENARSSQSFTGPGNRYEKILFTSTFDREATGNQSHDYSRAGETYDVPDGPPDQDAREHVYEPRPGQPGGRRRGRRGARRNKSNNPVYPTQSYGSYDSYVPSRDGPNRRR